MFLANYHLVPIHAFRAKNIELDYDPGKYAPVYYQLYLCKRGSGYFVDEYGEEHLINAGDMFLYAPHVYHKSRRCSNEPWELSYIAFSGLSVQNGLLNVFGIGEHSRIFRFDDITHLKIDKMMHDAVCESAENTLGNNAVMHTILYRILCEISISLNNMDEKKNEVDYGFSNVLTYIMAHLKGDLSLRTICDELNVSRHYLYTNFRDVLNTTPNEFITKCRMEHAAKLLSSEPEMTIKEVSLEAGIPGTSYFIKLFREYYSVTPAQYRELYPESLSAKKSNNELVYEKSSLPIYMTSSGDSCEEEVVYKDVKEENSYQLMYCISGMGALIDEDGDEHPISPGSVCFISPDSGCRYKKTSDNWEVIWVRFRGRYLTRFVRYLGLGETVVLKNSVALTLNSMFEPMQTYNFARTFVDIHKNSWRKSYADSIRQSADIYELLIYTSILSEADENISSTEEEKLVPAVDLINNRYAQKITNKQLADAAGISEAQLLKLFQRVYRKAPKEYITDYRLMRAKQLMLRHPNKSLKSIAKQTGFSDLEMLDEAFIQREGCTPVDYRNINIR